MEKSLNILSAYDIAVKLAKLATLEFHLITDDTGKSYYEETVEFSKFGGFTSERYNKTYNGLLSSFIDQVNCMVPDLATITAIKDLADSLTPNINKGVPLVFKYITKDDVFNAVEDTFNTYYSEHHTLSEPSKKELVNSVMNFLNGTDSVDISLDTVNCCINSIMYKFVEKK